MSLVLALAFIGAALYVLHRAALWAESRGFIYYLHSRPSRSALGNAFLEAQSLVEPGKRLLLEARREEPRDDAESGEPPGPDGGGEEDGRGGRGRA